MRQSKRFLKILVVGVLVLVLSVDTALASRLWRRSYFYCRPRICPPPPVCYYVWNGCTYLPLSYWTGKIETTEPVPAKPPAPEATPARPQPTPTPQETTQQLPEPALPEPEPVVETPGPSAEKAADLTVPVEKSAPAIDDLFGPTTEQPAKTPAIDNLFGPTTEQPAETPAADDLFGEPKPMAEIPADAPAKLPVEIPAEPPVATPLENDLFAPPAATAPVEEPSANQPNEKSTIDDLFGPPSATAPVEEPSANQPNEKSTIDDLFGPPSATAPVEEPSVEDHLPAPPIETAPTEKQLPEQPIEDDLFGNPQASSPTSVPGGLTSTELRRWTDNTGKYSVRGRLLWIRNGKVRILKETGLTTTLPVVRLSKDDRQFVRTQTVAALRALGVDSRTVQIR